MVESAMIFGGAPDQAALPIKIGQAVAVGRREMEVPVSLAIPSDAVTLVPLNGKQVAEVELRVVAMDARGGRAPMPVIPITLSADEAPKPGTFIRYDTKIRLRRMPQHPDGGHFRSSERQAAHRRGGRGAAGEIDGIRCSR